MASLMAVGYAAYRMVITLEVSVFGQVANLLGPDSPVQFGYAPLLAWVAVTSAASGFLENCSGLTGRCALTKFPQSYLTLSGATKTPSQWVEIAATVRCVTNPPHL